MPRIGTREEKAAYAREFYARPENALKNRARILCKTAIESGKLVRQPCEKCGEARTDAHHDDYTMPLNVRWLCKKCHGIEHQKTHCLRGHELSGDNLIIRRSRNERRCRECTRLHKRLAKLKREH